MTLQHLKFKAVPFVLGLTLLAAGCDKMDDNDPPVGNTIADIVVAGSSFTLLEQAVVRANLATTLGSAGPFTVFAPDDAAFTASGFSSGAIGGTSASDLSALLLYHTLGAEVPAASVPAGPNAKVTTASGDSVFVTRDSRGVFVNGIPVVQADIDASNGIIHRVNRVLVPPAGNIVETAVAAGLDSLVKAVTRATTAPGGDPALVTTLSNGILTVFAPTNQAFTGLLNALSLTNINDIPVATLLAVLRYHVVGGRAFSSDLANGNLTMFAGGTTTINLTGGTGGAPSITGAGNGTNRSTIAATNIMCRNGVVHVIDRVLLP